MLKPSALAERAARLDALDRSQAVIEFDLDGNVLTANQNFLAVMGYTLDEIVGRHHRMFVPEAERSSEAYLHFWDDLRAGRFQAGQFQRLARGGREVWIEATYNVILGKDDRPSKVVKYASDVTERQMRLADLESQAAAIRTSLAVIEFDLDGTILDANQNFLDTMGYTIGEIRGRHHRIFVDPAHAASPEYAAFWATLRSGSFLAARYERRAKDGRAVWIEASYNPILDAGGRPYKVVKFATDVSSHVSLLDHLKLLIDRNFGEIERALDTTVDQTAHASANSRSTTDAVQGVAAGIERMAASVSDISRSMALSRDSVEVAHEATGAAGEATSRLLQAATAMGGIVELIQDIASQINLLALNATIESARAGEAGRGFAVVANEVKNLAKQAADATEQISVEIDGVTAVSHDVAVLLGRISDAVGTVRDSVVSTAGAVDEQSDATVSMADAMRASAASVDRIGENLVEISGAVGQVANAVLRTKEAAEVLAR
ncbi:MAG: PAS domain-containing methyl-accepting chemotaxis protein [Acidimicrobiales bacterium]